MRLELVDDGLHPQDLQPVGGDFRKLLEQFREASLP